MSPVESLAELKLSFDPYKVREDFPILQRSFAGKSLVYLDSAATSQKPKSVIEATNSYYYLHNANVHRGVHSLGEEATTAFEESRKNIANFVDADPNGLVFVRNTTEALNLIAVSLARTKLRPGDRIVLTDMEHHSNIVPWQLVAKEKNLQLAFVPVTDDSMLDMTKLVELLDSPTKILAVTHQSKMPISRLCF